MSVKIPMKLTEADLPSNKKFGLFFTFIFGLVACFLYYVDNTSWAHVAAAVTLLFVSITLLKSDALLPLNKMWMLLGAVLGMIISPIVLGVIYFGLFTPIAILMRLGGRDELGVKVRKQPSHWTSRREPVNPESFKNLF